MGSIHGWNAVHVHYHERLNRIGGAEYGETEFTRVKSVEGSLPI